MELVKKGLGWCVLPEAYVKEYQEEAVYTTWILLKYKLLILADSEKDCSAIGSGYSYVAFPGSIR